MFTHHIQNPSSTRWIKAKFEYRKFDKSKQIRNYFAKTVFQWYFTRTCAHILLHRGRAKVRFNEWFMWNFVFIGDTACEPILFEIVKQTADRKFNVESCVIGFEISQGDKLFICQIIEKWHDKLRHGSTKGGKFTPSNEVMDRLSKGRPTRLHNRHSEWFDLCHCEKMWRTLWKYNQYYTIYIRRYMPQQCLVFLSFVSVVYWYISLC